MVKPTHNRAWLFVIPALFLLGFVAIIPLSIVVDYSFHDVFNIQAKIWLVVYFIIILFVLWVFKIAFARQESDNA